MDSQFEEQLNKYILSRAIVPNSLGLWETYYKRLCLAWGASLPEVIPQHLIFAADNGVSIDGLVGYNYRVTRQQSLNMVLGKSAVTLYCIFNSIPYEVIDVGIACDEGIGVNRKVMQGTKNMMHQRAMTVAQYREAYQAGYDRVLHHKDRGVNLFSFGEMGVGNTTTSAAVLSALTKLDPRVTVGPGTGPSDHNAVNYKMQIVRDALDFHEDHLETVEDIVSSVGGLDLAGMIGGMVACADTSTPFVIDGYITAVGMACATRLNKAVPQFGIPSHYSREIGMQSALAHSNIRLDEVPIYGQMALGEGTGAVLMVQLLKTVLYGFNHLASMNELMSR